MSGVGLHFSRFGWRDPVRLGDVPEREYQELWFSLARRPWKSAVLVPADRKTSAARFAAGLADVGGRLCDTPLTAAVADSISYEAVRMLTDLQLRVVDYRNPARGAAIETEIVPASSTPIDTGVDEQRPESEARRPIAPMGQLIVAIPPVVVEPLGVAVAHAADVVILCIEMGRTRLRHARRTIELIGAARFAGALLIR
jgi:hypothetical protein